MQAQPAGEVHSREHPALSMAYWCGNQKWAGQALC